MASSALLESVAKFFAEHGVALLVCWVISTAVFWYMGGFSGGASVPIVPLRMRRTLEVTCCETVRDLPSCMSPKVVHCPCAVEPQLSTDRHM